MSETFDLKPPYPQSPVVKQLVWDPPDAVERRALGPYKARGGKKDGSDNWPLTWADDDYMYTTYGDGHGFDPIIEEKRGLGIARVSGKPPSFLGENIRSDIENPNYGNSGKKGAGILCVDGVLYLWLFHADCDGNMSQLAISKDKGKHWEEADWKFEAFGFCNFINFGKNYEGARDNFVYVVSHDHPRAQGFADGMVLMRAPKDQIMNRAAYDFFVQVKPCLF